MKKPYTKPTIRQLSRGDLSPEQAEWIDSTMGDRARWTVRELAGLALSAVLFLVATFLVLFVASVVSGCSAPDYFLVDERFSVDERSEIQQAADYWDRATGGGCHVELVFGAKVFFGQASHQGQRVLIRATEQQAMASGHPSLSKLGRWGVRWEETDDLGIPRGEGIAIVPSRLAPGYRLRMAAAHELGHHFKAAHTSEPDSLMAETTPWTADRFVAAGCLSHADRLELCNAADCSHVTECAP